MLVRPNIDTRCEVKQSVLTIASAFCNCKQAVMKPAGRAMRYALLACVDDELVKPNRDGHTNCSVESEGEKVPAEVTSHQSESIVVISAQHPPSCDKQ